MSSEQDHNKDQTLAVIIPAYNEYPGIVAVLKELLKVSETLRQQKLYKAVQIIVVDDGSTDKTAPAVREFSDVQLIQLQPNRGYGAALKAGFASANVTHLAFLDADDTYPPQEFPELCRALIDQKADIVVGSRLAGSPSGMPRIRYLGNRIFTRLTSWAAGSPVSDCASGMRVFKREILPQIYPLPDGLDFTPAMTTRALLEGLNIVDVPISYHERVGPSKLNALKDGFRFLGSILKMSTYYNPLKFFGLAGLFLLVIGLAYGIEPIIHYLRFQEVPERYIYRLLAILTFWLGGLQIVAFGILANFSLSVYQVHVGHKHKLMQFFQRRALYIRLDLLGIIMIITALILNKSNIYEYFSVGTISGHWSYLVVGAILILTGIQVFTVNILIRIFAAMKQREEFIAQDLGKHN